MTEAIVGGWGDEATLIDHRVEILTSEQCLALLASQAFGRVAVCVNALPAIFPVNYRLHEERIYFWTAEGTKLAAATNRAIVAFQIDHADAMEHSGWSVMAVGQARALSPQRAGELAWLPVKPWAPGPRSQLVEIPADLVSGRRIRRDPPSYPAY